ncbi:MULTISPECIES: phosphoribulokinase [unclassified Inquilinus]|jgi:phosphoribulokinase|uniref:phosphoribulokinase n=1 Tax=unclassified Inquilinus TaxID=2645927 RepID=UPI003F915F9B
MSKPAFDRPIILGIVGDSAAGKTTLSRGIAEILGPQRCTLICTDDYHRYDRRERAANGVSALDPAGNYVDILEQHLQLLRSGQPILKPVYNHDQGTLDRPDYIEPKEFVVAEGLLGYATRAMRDCYDVKIYLDPEEELRVRWKVHRDTTKRGYTAEQVLESLKKREFDSPTFIRPQRLFADIVIRFQRPPGANAAGHPDTDHRLDVAHILRPTLPHPNFSRLIEAVGDGSVGFELTRDEGKPVDVLEIRGSISDRRADRVEEYLWDHIPEAGHLREAIGRYDGAAGRAISHPLALTQLLVAFHMVKAAQGVHAV